MGFKAVAWAIVAGALVATAFSLAEAEGQWIAAPITGPAIGNFDASAVPSLGAPAKGLSPEVTPIPLGYTDKIVVNITACKVVSDTTHHASTVVTIIHGVGKGNRLPYTKHSCKVVWPRDLSTIGWSAADITRVPAPILSYGVVACGHTLATGTAFYDPYDPCTDPARAYPMAYEENAGTMTVLLFNTMDQAATKQTPAEMSPPVYLNVTGDSRNLA